MNIYTKVFLAVLLFLTCGLLGVGAFVEYRDAHNPSVIELDRQLNEVQK